ncbi:MAG: 4-hydroxy-tetrahydrodipicolinate synthase [Hyphomonadaceae bacterium]|nr:MAG: dihydrodipicolinate synthase [Caulobacteraceae bacterium]MBT9444982.1 4-hydroxy-tetrahydrodipicolinate synthase [Hyphomonadaceae bacterium]TPW04781.1 MAG: dihydrodipicolinate synthase [Alphaproteobacteria bacterium]
MTSHFSGAYTALVTPFRDGKVDEAAFVSVIERQIVSGIHGLVPNGTTGEAPTLSVEEQKRVISLCVETAKGRVPVVAGTGSNDTAKTIALTRHAKEAGADAALVVTPYYNRPQQPGLIAHYTAIADAVELPIILYNVPGRTAVDLLPDTVATLAKHPNIVGHKDASGAIDRATRQRIDCGPGFALFSGNDESAVGFNAQGGQGCISVTANVAPELCARLQQCCLAGDFGSALDIDLRLSALHKALFLEPSPAPTKYALAKLGICSEDSRLPLVPVSAATRAAIDAAMKIAGLL